MAPPTSRLRADGPPPPPPPGGTGVSPMLGSLSTGSLYASLGSPALWNLEGLSGGFPTSCVARSLAPQALPRTAPALRRARRGKRDKS